MADDVLTALAQELADSELGEWNPVKGATYSDSDLGIVIGDLPVRPAGCIALQVIDIDQTDAYVGSLNIFIRVVVRTGSDSTLVHALTEQVREVFEDISDLPFGDDAGVIQLAWRRSSDAPWQDKNRRWCQASSFQLRVDSDSVGD